MQTLPGESIEQAVYREGNLAGKAFVDRMADVRALPEEGLVTLSSMLIQICAQLMDGDLDHAQHMLDDIMEAASEGLPSFCEFVRAYHLVEKASG